MASVHSLFYRLAAALIVRLVPFFIKGISGLERLPENGPYVLVANHISPFDHLLVGAVIEIVYGRKVYFLAKKRLFRSRLSRLWGNSMGAIPVDPGTKALEPYRRVRDLLKQGEIVCVYPEGAIGQGAQMLPFKRGAIWIASQSCAPVVPVGIIGTDLVLRKGQYIPTRHLVSLAFGAIMEPQSSPRETASPSANLLGRVREAIELLADANLSPTRNPKEVRSCSEFLRRRAFSLRERARGESVRCTRTAILRRASRIMALARRISPFEREGGCST